MTVNVADNTLEDGTLAHPDDLERFQPFRERFEETGGRKITKCESWSYTRVAIPDVELVHWFANPHLETKFEKAREVLQSLGRPAKEELVLFHGTLEANFES